VYGALRDLPGFLTVKGASNRLRLAPRSVRDLIYVGRLPSVRLGRLHFLRSADVEAERRRRLGLPLPELHRRAAQPSSSALRGQTRAIERPLTDAAPLESRVTVVRRRPVDSSTRRERAAERAQLLQRWLNSGHRPSEPYFPFSAVTVAAADTCEVCGRAVRAGGRMVNAQQVFGRDTVRLCTTCARRAMLAWADERRREAAAARQLARELGLVLAAAPPPTVTV
jgi:hypothetical protein